MAKEHWPNRWIFILAAIGSAAGIGNLWRFPTLAFEHGGGAFVIAIIVANILVGLPLLALEVGLGQMTQKAAPDALAKIRKGFKYIGWTAVTLGFMVLTYYMAVVAWGLDFFAASFNLSWGNDAASFFFNDILQVSEGPSVVGGISWPVFSALIIGWILVYFSVWKGVKSISKVIKWSVTLPFVILAVLIVRAVTLPGAGEGLSLFLRPDWQALMGHEIWLAAFSQVFFSLSLAFGIMIAYGGLRQKTEELVQSTWWIVGGNFLVSLMSGLVVFGTLGYMAGVQGVPVQDVVSGGPGLAFITFPTAISLLPAFNALIAALFFLTFFTLAIDSAFSLLEAISSAIHDRFSMLDTRKITFVLVLIGIIAGLPFATKAGIYYLDIVDHFIVNYGLVIIGLLEALIVGWIFGAHKLLAFINENSPRWKFNRLWSFAVKVLIPVFLLILLVLNIRTELASPYEGYPGWALLYIGILPLIAAPFIGALLDKLIKHEN